MFEQYTEGYFLDQAKTLGEQLGVDTRQGSVYMDAAAGHCLRVAKFYSDLRSMLEMLAINTCYGDILDEKAKERQIYRKEATASYYECSFDGVNPGDMEGDRFMAGNYYFVLVKKDEAFYLQSEVAGSETNFLLEGISLIPMQNITGLRAATLGRLYIAGTDQESDDSLRERFQNALSAPAENGNKQQYKIWCESYEGVGRAIISPLEYGDNTVKALIISSEGTPPTEALITQIQMAIDPDSEGLGEGLAPIGCKFYAVGAAATEINLSFDVEIAAGYTSESALEEAKKELNAYFKRISLDTSDEESILVQYVQVVRILADTPGIKDFSNLTLNGLSGNIPINADSVPVLGEVNMNASV